MMITFKQFLSERDNMRAYRKVLKSHGDQALVGFEVEVFIPRDHEIAQDNGSEHALESVSIRNFDTYTEFEDYFTISRDQQRYIDADYEEWLDRQREQYIQDHLDDGVSKADLEAEFESKQDEEYSWVNWFNDEHSSAFDFVNNYDLEPRYGWAVKNGRDSKVFSEPEEDLKSNWKDDIGSLIADRLQRDYLKSKTVERGEPGIGNGSFMVVPDTSIEADEGEAAGYGAEIVTPPLPYEDAINCLSKIFDFISDENLQTNSSTGLHINISVPNIERLDPVKLVLFMGDEYVLKQFKREGNSMTRPQIETLRGAVANYTLLSSSSEVGQLLANIAKHLLMTGKYKSVNLNKLKDGYLEFRSAGNRNYHHDITAVEQLVGRWMSAMTVACDPKKDKDLYLKKLAKIFDQVNPSSKQDEDLIATLMKIAPVAKQLPLRKGEEFIQTLLLVAEKVGAAVPTFVQMKQMRVLMKEAGVKVDQIMNAIDDGHDRKEITYFLRSFKLI